MKPVAMTSGEVKAQGAVAAAVEPAPVETSDGGDAEEAIAGPARSARREATRQRILDAAREVFAERGVFGGTVEDICERAGFTRGAFYSNFVDKDDVLEALVEREHERLLAHLDASFALVDHEVAEAHDLADALTSIVDHILRSVPVDRQLALVQTELEIHAVRRPDLSAPFLATNARFRARIAGFIEQAMARHDRVLLVSALDLADAAVAIVERSIRRSLLEGPASDPDAMARAVLPGLLLALSSRGHDGR